MNKKEKFNEKDPFLLTPQESELLRETVSARIQKMEAKNRWKHLGVAVSLLLLLGIAGFAGYDRYMSPDVYMAQFSPLDMTLEDGTVIRLFEGGKLTVEKSFPGKTRDVYLEGNAVFRVAKSKEHPFIVHGTDYVTTVLGTVFKVIQQKGAFKVDLYEGKVSITKNGDKEEIYILSPNETFTNYGTQKIAAIVPLKQDALPSAQNEIKAPEIISLQFKECRFADAVKVIEEVYHIKVLFPKEYRDKLVTTRLTDMSPDIVLQSLALSMRLELQQHGTTYQLEK